MRVDADVAHSAGETAAGLQRNVAAVDHVLLGETEVDHVDRLFLAQFATTDDEVVRLHVAVDQIARMNELDSQQLNNT